MNSFVANGPQSVPVKKNYKSRSIFGKDMDKNMVARFLDQANSDTVQFMRFVTIPIIHQ